MSLRDEFRFYSPIRELANTVTFIFYVFSIIYYLNCDCTVYGNKVRHRHGRQSAAPTAGVVRRAGEPGPYGMSAAGQAHTVRPYSEVTRGMSDTVLVPTAGTSRYLA